VNFQLQRIPPCNPTHSCTCSPAARLWLLSFLLLPQIHGTCLGFQLLHILVSNVSRNDLLVETDSVTQPSTLIWPANGAEKSSRMFGTLPVSNAFFSAAVSWLRDYRVACKGLFCVDRLMMMLQRRCGVAVVVGSAAGEFSSRRGEAVCSGWQRVTPQHADLAIKRC
jgi:hypothetical protein